MLRECSTHGPFRGAECEECGEEGRFIMNDRELDHLGRIMAGILRHFPDRFDLEMDPRGWVDIEDMCEAIRDRRDRFHWLRVRHIESVCETDPKGRYELDAGFVRATYGHSLKLDMDLPTEGVPDTLFYPVAEEELELVLDRGLTPSDRAMVHLSETYENALSAGLRRVENPIILEIDAARAISDGYPIFSAGKTVYTTENVPGDYITQTE